MTVAWHKQRRPVQVNLTPLIDIVFILIIFVLLAARFDRVQGLSVALPSVAASRSVPSAPLNLQISAEGALTLNDLPVDLEVLGERLLVLKADSKALVVAADRAATVQVVARAFAIAQAVGFEAVTLRTGGASR